MTTLALANQKGGVAKTTSVATLGAALAELGRSVLLVDLDPQACLTFSLGVDPEDLDLTVREVLAGECDPAEAVLATAEGVDLLPASIELARTEAELGTGPGLAAAGVVRESLGSATLAGYDWVLLDCPPSLGGLTVAGLTAADAVLVPLQCETLAHRGVGQLLDTVHDVREHTNPALEVWGVLPTMFDPRTIHARTVLESITSTFGLQVVGPPIPKSVRFAEAPSVGLTLLSTHRRSKGAQAYRQVARALEERRLADRRSADRSPGEPVHV